MVGHSGLQSQPDHDASVGSVPFAPPPEAGPGLASAPSGIGACYRMALASYRIQLSQSLAHLIILVRLFVIASLLGALGTTVAAAPTWQSGRDLTPVFDTAVTRRLAIPADEVAAYAQRLDAALAGAGVVLARPQYVLLVDRSPQVQAIFVYWRDAQGGWHLIGAAPVSTGSRGGFEHFITPLGVFAHSTAHPDFRAEGTVNEFGVRGYGIKGMRVFDFGWVPAERTWGSGGVSPMRLQMHATDPALLEPRLGQPASKGCIRIPADLNRLIDRYGLLDADYEAELAQGKSFWVLLRDRTPTPWSGRYLVVVDSQRATRPAWATRPATAKQPAGSASAAGSTHC